MPSPFQWLYYIARFIYHSKGNRKKYTTENKTYFRLLKKLIQMKQGQAYEKSKEDDIADLRTDIQYDMAKMREQIHTDSLAIAKLTQGYREAGKANESAIENEKEVKKLREQVESLEKLNALLTSKLETQS